MQIIENIKRELRDSSDLEKSGTAFMSHVSTLRKGKFLVVGLNPGGTSVGCTNIGQSLEKFLRDDYLPFDEKWENAKYQLGIKALFKHLNVDLRSVCVTNFIYERSKTEKDLPIGSINSYRKILKKVIELVEPEVIIVLGVTVFAELRALLSASSPTKHESGHLRYFIYVSQASLNTHPIKLICLPHLSRYALYTKKAQLDFIKNEIGV
jgi:hypothetical protein